MVHKQLEQQEIILKSLYFNISMHNHILLKIQYNKFKNKT